MRIVPVEPIHNNRSNYRDRRAQMSVRYDVHTVTDSETGERFDLDPVSAWKKFNQLNGVMI